MPASRNASERFVARLPEPIITIFIVRRYEKKSKVEKINKFILLFALVFVTLHPHL